ncbi:F-box domain protein [Colletotrichum chrysophilum]|uniref:F-box domain protein n=1 Tax=Colletotrichum chrysophilum TaxID=1836956 RepID=A0AAD9E8B3_9PEZI|nr:F-box domain protein [Colletotrichum chrysophilum]
MTKLTQLPAELLRKILSNLLNINSHVAYLVLPLFQPNAADLATLKAASRTCRVLRDVAEPLIWRHLCLTQPRRKGHPTTRQLIGLIRLWHERPELAGHVHTLYLSGDELPFGPQVINEDDIAFVSQVLQEFGFQLSHPWFQAPGHVSNLEPWHKAFNNLSFITALIVLMARNVRALDLFVGGDFFKCMPSPGETSARLELLSHLRCHSTTGEFMARMNPLLRLAPSLRKLQVWQARLSHGEDLDWSGFTSLELTGVDASEAAIANVVRSCRGLREFTFSPDTGHAPNETMAALLMHASTLRKLDVNFGAEGQEDGLCVGSVAAFTSLEELGISVWEMGWDEECILHMLPKSLRSLEIDGYPRDDECRQEIEWLAGAVEAGTYPNLKEVWLSGWECDSDHPGPCWGTYVDENNPLREGVDQHGSDWEYDSDEEEDGCDGGRTVTELRAMLLEAGVSCKIRPP